MDDRDGAVRRHQQGGDRPPDDIGAAEHDRLGTRQVGMHAAQQMQAPLRRAGYQRRKPAPQPPDIQRMKPVHILVRVDGCDDRAGIDRRRQGQLDQYPVHPVVAVQPVDLGKQGRLRYVGRQPVVEGGEPGGGASAALAVDVDLAAGVFADENRREAGDDVAFATQFGRGRGHPLAQFRGDRLAADNPCRCHALLPGAGPRCLIGSPAAKRRAGFASAADP